MAKGIKSVKTAKDSKPKLREQTLREDLVNESLLTISEVCQILRVGASKLEDLDDKGILIKGKIGRSVRYDREQVIAYRNSIFSRDSKR